MKRIFVLTIGILLLVMGAAFAQTRQVEMTFENRLLDGSRVDFYTDGHFSCSANQGATCPSMEQDTDHALEARVNGRVIRQHSYTREQLRDGGYNWGVCVIGKTCPNN